MTDLSIAGVLALGDRIVNASATARCSSPADVFGRRPKDRRRRWASDSVRWHHPWPQIAHQGWQLRRKGLGYSPPYGTVFRVYKQSH
jgi:hypothetical protein